MRDRFGSHCPFILLNKIHPVFLDSSEYYFSTRFCEILLLSSICLFNFYKTTRFLSRTINKKVLIWVDSSTPIDCLVDDLIFCNKEIRFRLGKFKPFGNTNTKKQNIITARTLVIELFTRLNFKSINDLSLILLVVLVGRNQNFIHHHQLSFSLYFQLQL